MEVLFGILQILTVAVILVLLYRPLGDYMARIFTTSTDLKVERGFYRLIGVDSQSEQTWRSYLRSVLVVSIVGVLFIYLLQRLQAVLPYSLGFPAIPEGLSFNTAASFVTNTDWQSYSPDVTMGYTVQLAGLAVQNFVSAAVGIAIAIALVRGFARRTSGTIGNFWVDLTRSILRLLLPIAFVSAIVLIIGGELQRLFTYHRCRRCGAISAWRSNCVSNSDQDAGYERWGVLQRELCASVRESHTLDQRFRDRSDARDSLCPAAYLRSDGG